MKWACFSIAGISFRFISHGTAAPYLLSELKALWPDLPGGEDAEAEGECLIYLDHEITYPHRFDTEPHIIRRDNSETYRMLFTRMESIAYPYLSIDATAVCFLNGCLIFDAGFNRGLIYVFNSVAANQFVGTLHRLIFVYTCMVMVNKSRLMVHGAGIKKRNGQGGFLFLGDSGAGKSTVARLSSDDIILSDDATTIEIKTGAAYIHATPFSQTWGRGVITGNMCGEQEELHRIFFLHQSVRNFVRPRELINSFTELLTRHLHCFELMEEDLKRKAFYLCREVCEKTPSCDLYFRNDPDFWELIVAE